MTKNLIQLNKQQIFSESDPFTIKRYELFFKHFKASYRTVLDFGCNTGRGGKVLWSLNKDLIIIGADIVKERLDRLPFDIYNQAIDLSNVELLTNLKNIDAIVSGEVFEHIPFDILLNYLSSFYKILSPGGMIILTTPNPDSFLVRMGRDAVLLDPTHINIMSRKFLSELLHKMGFKNIVIKGSGKAVNYFGENFPLFNIYGSYLIIAYK